MHTFLATLTVLLTTFPEGGLPLPLSLQEQHHLSLAHPPQPFLVNCSQHSAWHSTDSMQFWRMHELVNHWRSWSADKKALHGCSCLKHTSCCRKQEAGRPELQLHRERTPLPPCLLQPALRGRSLWKDGKLGPWSQESCPKCFQTWPTWLNPEPRRQLWHTRDPPPAKIDVITLQAKGSEQAGEMAHLSS